MRILVLAACLLVFTVPQARAQCVGDCNGDGRVDITELLIGVNITLGARTVADCDAFANGAGMVDIAQLVEAVKNALYGCGAGPRPTVSPTPTPQSDRFVDNGDGTITDTRTSLIWEKKDASGGLHDFRSTYLWGGLCSNGGYCQPDRAAATTCNGATGDPYCAECPSPATCNNFGGTTIWQWLNQLNGANFAGHSDWRIPADEPINGILEPEWDPLFDLNAPRCRAGGLCISSAFNSGCTEGCAVERCSCTQGAYWGAEPYVACFSDASLLFLDRTTALYVRAVRGGP